MMLKYYNYDVVFREIPDEVTLALNITNCPFRCDGCHSPHLRDDIGEALDERVVGKLLDRYGDAISCVCFMGGDADYEEIGRLSRLVKTMTKGAMKTAWYSGRNNLPKDFRSLNLDYIKIGEYRGELGALDTPTTNQRLFQVSGNDMVDLTMRFRVK